MSLPGRLWRRAPAWRLTLVAALATTALAAMFPPHLPNLHRAPPPLQPAAHYIQNAPPSAALQQEASDGVVETPPPRAGRAGPLPYAGHQLPVPSGRWQEIALARGSTPLFIQSQLYARIDNGSLTGLAYTFAPSPLSGAAGPPAAINVCYASAAAIAGAVVAQPTDNEPQLHECWTLNSVDMSGNQARTNQDVVLHNGIARLDQLGVTIPSHMLCLIYYRSNQNGWAIASLFLPDSHATSQDAIRQLQAWATRTAAALHSGYDNAAGGVAEPP